VTGGATFYQQANMAHGVVGRQRQQHLRAQQRRDPRGYVITRHFQPGGAITSPNTSAARHLCQLQTILSGYGSGVMVAIRAAAWGTAGAGKLGTGHDHAKLHV